MAFDAKGSHKYIPTPIIFDILLHLSVEEILTCKRVCKAWHGIISEPHFIELYFAGAARTDAYPLIWPLGYGRVSRTLYFVDPKNYICDTSARLNLRTKFKIPLFNYERVLQSESYLELTQESGGGKRKRCLELNRYDHIFDIMNTCNGLLCLTHSDNVIISNPINGEFVNVPVPTVTGHPAIYALGFCPRTNNYKVIRVCGQSGVKWWIHCTPTGYESSFSGSAQICTLGSSLWENIGLAPAYCFLYHPTFLNGILYWLYFETKGPQFILSFDFDSNHFRACSLPSVIRTRYNTRIGVLRDQFCLCDASKRGYLDIWVMSKNGVQGYWTKICNMSLSGDQSIGDYGFYQPITRLQSGAILLFHCKNHRNFGLIYYEPEKQRIRYLKIKDVSKFEATGCYTPTFRSLKDVLVGNEVEVLNINSRCAELKIQRESNPLYLFQENIA